MENEEHRQGFIRQRRNLLGISLILIFTHFVDMKFKTISFLGNSADIENPANVIYFLWILWTYWLVRYFQYFGLVARDNFKNDFVDARCGVFSLFAKPYLYCTDSQLKHWASGYGHIVKKVIVTEAVPFQHPRVTGSKSSEKIWTVNYRVRAQVLVDGHDEPKLNEFYVKEIGLVFTIFLNILAFIYTSISTRYATEYLIPIFFAVFTAFVAQPFL